MFMLRVKMLMLLCMSVFTYVSAGHKNTSGEQQLHFFYATVEEVLTHIMFFVKVFFLPNSVL